MNSTPAIGHMHVVLKWYVCMFVVDLGIVIIVIIIVIIIMCFFLLWYQRINFPVFFVCLFVCWNKTRKIIILCLMCWEESKPPESDHTRTEAQTTCVPKTVLFVCLFVCLLK